MSDPFLPHEIWTSDDVVIPDEMQKTILYDEIIELLQQIKLVHGPVGLDSTLKRHKRLWLFLNDYQKTAIIDLEGKIS